MEDGVDKVRKTHNKINQLNDEELTAQVGLSIPLSRKEMNSKQPCLSTCLHSAKNFSPLYRG
jgi:hypothetical protein